MSSSQASGEVDYAFMDEDEQLQHALAASLLELGEGNLAKLAVACQGFPYFLKVHPITPNGWCFYDCVSKDLACDDDREADAVVPIEVVIIIGVRIRCQFRASEVILTLLSIPLWRYDCFRTTS